MQNCSFFLFGLVVFFLCLPVLEGAERKKAAAKHKPVQAKTAAEKKQTRFICQPNGWGCTPEMAVSDLDRVMSLYDHEPGFRRDNYVSLIQIGKNVWQADGRCSFLGAPVPASAPRFLPPHVVTGAVSGRY